MKLIPRPTNLSAIHTFVDTEYGFVQIILLLIL